MKEEHMFRRSLPVFVGLLTLALIPIALARPMPTKKKGAALGKPLAYNFTPIAFLDNPAPGGGNFTFDFEPSAINNRSDVAFTADLTTGGEGVFIGRRGQLAQILRHGQPAPGGGTFGPIEFGRLGLNARGDVAIPFSLEPFDFIPALNSGLFRFFHSKQTLSAVAVPGTPAPGGGEFAGVYFNTAINNRGDIVFSGIVTGGAILIPPRHQATWDWGSDSFWPASMALSPAW